MNKQNIQLIAEMVKMVTQLQPRFYINLVILLLIAWVIYRGLGEQIECIGICFK